MPYEPGSRRSAKYGRHERRPCLRRRYHVSPPGKKRAERQEHALGKYRHRRNGEPGPISVAAKVAGNAANEIENRVKNMAPNRVLERYHDLVDKRLLGHLRSPEAYEIGCLEARLEIEENGEADGLTGFRRQWQQERDELVASIEHLLAALKSRQ